MRGTTCTILELKCQQEPKSTSCLKKYSNTCTHRTRAIPKGRLSGRVIPKGSSVRCRYLTCPCRLVLLLCPPPFPPVCRRTYAVEAERSNNRCNALLSGNSGLLRIPRMTHQTRALRYSGNLGKIDHNGPTTTLP